MESPHNCSGESWAAVSQRIEHVAIGANVNHDKNVTNGHPLSPMHETNASDGTDGIQFITIGLNGAT